jgi:Mismatch repair ATPase (MutS family)
MNANHQSNHFQMRHHPRNQQGIQGGGRSTPGERAQQYQHTNQRGSFGDAVKNAAASARRTRNHGTEQSGDRNAHDNSQPDNNHYHSNSAAPPMEQSLKCMTAVEEGSRIAFACYDEEKNEILLEESPYGSSSDSSYHDLEAIVQTFTSFVRPNLVLISSKVASNPLLLDFLTRNPAAATSSQQHLRPNGEVQQGEHTTASTHFQSNTTAPSSVNIPYQLLKTKSFDLKQCKHIILHKLRVMSLMRRRTRAVEQQQNYDTDLSAGGIDAVPGLMDSRPSSKYHSIASIVNFDSTCLLRALGSLLCFLQGSVFRLEEGNTITVNSINYARSSQYMRIDKDTLHSLHIFSTEHHPLTGAKGSGKDKEGFSLFTLLDRTKSKMGRECLKEWMMKPLLDPASIRERQNGVALFLHPFCRETSGNLLNHLSKVGAVDKIIQKMQKCHSVPMDFIVLSRTLAAAVAIYGTLNGELRNRLMYEYRQGTLNDAQSADGESGIWQEFAVVEKIIDDIHLSVLQDLHDRIVSIVDHEATMEAKESVVIHYGFHEELDRAKELFDNLDGKTQYFAFILFLSAKSLIRCCRNIV